MQYPREIKISLNNYEIHLSDNDYTVISQGITLSGNIYDLSVPQRVWLENAHACSESFINSLNFGNTLGI